MSVQTVGKGKNRRHHVRWREGGRHRSRSFIVKADAEAFDLDIKRRQQLGPLAAQTLQSRLTLAEFVERDWWPRYAVPNLKASTQTRYLETWGSHLLGQLGGYELRQITPLMVEDYRAQLDRRGVSVSEQRRAMMLLQGILRRAVVRGLLPMNAAQIAEKPRQVPTARPEPLSPVTVEAIRSRLSHRDATLVSILAYAGLRPGEATSLRWRNVGQPAMSVYADKTRQARNVRILGPLAQDLNEWRLASGRPPDSALVIPSIDGNQYTKADFGNFRYRRYQPAARDAGVTGDMRPYRLRSSFVSLLLAEGRALPYVAAQAGHSVAVLARHYAGVLMELEEAPTINAEAAIREARVAGAGRDVG